MNVRYTQILANRVHSILFNNQQNFDQIKLSPYDAPSLYGAPSLSYVLRKTICMAIDHHNFFEHQNFFDAFDQSVGGLYKCSTSASRHEDFQMIFDIADALVQCS